MGQRKDKDIKAEEDRERGLIIGFFLGLAYVILNELGLANSVPAPLWVKISLYLLVWLLGILLLVEGWRKEGRVFFPFTFAFFLTLGILFPLAIEAGVKWFFKLP